MQMKLMIVGLISCGVMNSAYAIDAKYRQQLEFSGCTQLSELQGCDISKTKEENIKAGFVQSSTVVTDQNTSISQPQWIAERRDGTSLARIKIDQQQRIWVNDLRVIAVKNRDQISFRQGKINYTIFTDTEKQSQSFWYDRYSKDKGKIVFK
ncbi:hypothetical protein F991_01855 [Acinetobacter sp. CIP-A165]|uniref:hypothetical protein n=1 Tax=Acinetobacter sp. CIP-A165 TaxID=40373 RepID=UPI0002CF1A74|nr:hypothetical protein [Acinetobacter sp. CIP-A165]ENU30058.1 hypothetical protein F991_01855 [Acinetobacter sp. CIP-A165]